MNTLLYTMATIMTMLLELYPMMFPIRNVEDYRHYNTILQCGIFVLYIYIGYILFWGHNV